MTEKKIHLEWETEPTVSNLATSKFHIWETLDGRFQVARVESTGRDSIVFGAQIDVGGRWDIFEYDHKLGCGYPRYYKSLEDALESVEILLSKKWEVTSNKEEVISCAHKQGLDGVRKKVPAQESPGEPKIRVPRPNSGNKMGCLDAAALVLEEEGRPLTPKEMYDLMEERGYWSSPKGATPWATIGASMGTEISKLGSASRFKKVSRGVFDLA